MKILGIETSRDDTAAALVEATDEGFFVHSNVIASQAQLHKKYGGVVPEMAARKHVETMLPVITEALNGASPDDIDVIAATQGPGLITSLHVGVETAKALSYAWNMPLVGVNHIEGHVYSAVLPPSNTQTRGIASLRHISFPAITLIVSGGHTELILMTNHGRYKLLGRTRDDAAGEAFDKAAKMLGLGYPGGPEISKRAATGDPNAFDLPRPMLNQDGYEFSFSGLKNAIRLLIERVGRGAKYRASTDGVLSDLCASIEQTIVDVLTIKSLRAIEEYHPKTFILAGGVSANKTLRATLEQSLPDDVAFLCPHAEYTQDNAAMIAAAGYYQLKKRKRARFDSLTANANWELA